MRSAPGTRGRPPEEEAVGSTPRPMNSSSGSDSPQGRRWESSHENVQSGADNHK